MATSIPITTVFPKKQDIHVAIYMSILGFYQWCHRNDSRKPFAEYALFYEF